MNAGPMTPHEAEHIIAEREALTGARTVPTATVVRADTPVSLLKNALQIIALQEEGWDLQALHVPCGLSWRELYALRDLIGAAVVGLTKPAPDPAMADLTTTLADMEKTNRELALRGDELAVALEVEP